MEAMELTKAGIDLNELMSRLMQNERLVQVFVKKFLEDQTFVILTEAVAQADYAKAEGASHTLKGVCGNLAIKNLFALFSEQVRLFRAGEPDGAVAMMAEITAAYENSTAHMRAWLQGL